VAERLIQTDGVDLCTEAFGQPSDPPLLLIMGIGASMLWWDEEFCRMLVDGGRFVIRYDHRDTGRSTSYEPGKPGYTGDDLVDDAVRVLDGYGIERAHLVGVSMGGALAQLVALDFPERVASVVLMSTTFAVPVKRSLPGVAEEYVQFLATAEGDRADPDSVVENVVAECRVLAGPRPFDEAEFRDLARREVRRARNFASAGNHAELPDGNRSRAAIATIAAPTLVIHGTADPLFPVEHGRALAEEIPGARLVTLPDAGHLLARADWEVTASAILEHTAG
jgi:pimeloyl-ACP methyl ester carboxylesterase